MDVSPDDDTHVNGLHDNESLIDCVPASVVYSHNDDQLERFWCMEPVHNNGTSVQAEYNEGTGRYALVM